jgi:hypothetical protein
MSTGFHSFLLLGDKQNSKCVCGGGGVGGHKMHIFTSKTYISFKIYKIGAITNEFHEFC